MMMMIIIIDDRVDEKVCVNSLHQ
jgi:hypothetical protein